jgi:hypothetical protein
MRSFLENKAAYVATVSLFSAALAWNAVHGGSSAVPGHMLLPLDRSDVVAHGPIMPPDPWEGVRVVAHGPIMPPDPWEGVRVVAHGPIMPPDPWEGVRVVAHGPIMPPDPWEGHAASIA